MKAATLVISNWFPFTNYSKVAEHVAFDNNPDRGYKIIMLEYHYKNARDLSIWIKNHPLNRFNKFTVIHEYGKSYDIKIKKYPCRLHSLKIRDDGLIKVVLYVTNCTIKKKDK